MSTCSACVILWFFLDKNQIVFRAPKAFFSDIQQHQTGYRNGYGSRYAVGPVADYGANGALFERAACHGSNGLKQIASKSGLTLESIKSNLSDREAALSESMRSVVSMIQ